MSTPTATRSVTIAAEPDGPVSPTNGHREPSSNPLDPTDTAHVIDPLVENATHAREPAMGAHRDRCAPANPRMPMLAGTKDLKVASFYGTSIEHARARVARPAPVEPSVV